MGRLASTRAIANTNIALQTSLNKLIDMLDTGYIVEGNVGGHLIRVEVTPGGGLQVYRDDVLVSGIDSNGNAVFGGALSGGSIWIPNSTTPVFSVDATGVMTATSGTFNGTISGGSISIPATSPKFSIASDGSFNVYDGNASFWDDLYCDATITVDNDILPTSNNNSYCGTDADPWYQVWGRQLHAKDDVYGDSFIPNSDARLKTEIQPVVSGVELILNLEPVQYKMVNGNNGRIHYGFLAQQLKTAMTESGIEDAGVYVDRSLDLNPDTGVPDNEYLAIRYDELISPMVQTIQSLEKRIKELETRLGSV